MVKKRAKLSGQGKEMFFSDAVYREDTNEIEDKIESNKAPIISVKRDEAKDIPDDFIQKIKVLKEMIEQFKKLFSSEEFNKFKGKDLGNMINR